METLTEQKLPQTPSHSCDCKGGFLEGCWKVSVFIWKFLVGAAFTQSLVTSFLAAGWTCRNAQREVLKTWWRQAEKEGPNPSFMQFIHGSSATLPHRVTPNWFFEQNTKFSTALATPGIRGKLWAILRKLFKSLAVNVKLGLQVTFNTWVLTLPGCVMWLWSWYDGWNNSFNKGYENAIVGPTTGVLGILMFIAAMYYVPMAQMRQASTGQWRSFYEFKLVLQLIRKQWMACFVLAGLYTLCSLPLMILKTLPAFFSQMNPAWIDASAITSYRASEFYYLACGFLVFGLFVLLRTASARIYARAVLSLIRAGSIPEDALADYEWQALHRLDLLRCTPSSRRHAVVEAITWFGSRVGRLATGFAMFFLWFAFCAQVYVSEFVMKTDLGKGWLNQPLVQLPYFNYTPRALRSEAQKEKDLLKAQAKSAQNTGTSPSP